MKKGSLQDICHALDQENGEAAPIKDGAPESSLMSHNHQQQQDRSFSHGQPEKKFCSYLAHVVEECWRPLKSCLVCGKDHSMEQCPKYNPRFKSRSKSHDENKRQLLN